MSLSDQPVHLLVRGLNADENVTLTLTSTDGRNIRWRSAATFRASSSGVVDLDQSAPLSGTYVGVFGMGLISSMQPTTDVQAEYVYPGITPQYPNFTEQAFNLNLASASGGRASTTFKRRLPAAVSAQYLTLQAAGFIGTFYRPSKIPPQPTSILSFGGSEGGNSTTLLGVALASHGFPTLSVAYFRLPGLPPTLSNIPLEYFVNAIQWLDRQPGIDPSHVVVSGISRGSEAALLLGVHFPQFVHGVMASVPSNVALCGLPSCTAAAWTLGGQPLPYTTQFDQPKPTDATNAVIQVEKIKGPILLDCGGWDRVWTSCAFAQAIEGRLNDAHDPSAHPLYAYPNAGHGIGGLVPYEPAKFNALPVNGRAANIAGDTPEANAVALADLWPKVLAFLQTAG